MVSGRWIVRRRGIWRMRLWWGMEGGMWVLEWWMGNGEVIGRKKGRRREMMIMWLSGWKVWLSRKVKERNMMISKSNVWICIVGYCLLLWE